MSLRPERQAPPEIFYNDAEARKYTTSSRMIDIQVRFAASLKLSSSFVEFYGKSENRCEL